MKKFKRGYYPGGGCSVCGRDYTPQEKKERSHRCNPRILAAIEAAHSRAGNEDYDGKSRVPCSSLDSRLRIAEIMRRDEG